MHRKYLQHMHRKSTHERRQHAMQVAGVATALVFAVWVTTLGVRLSSDTPVATTEGAQTQLSASAVQSQKPNVQDDTPRLEVSTTSVLY